jgi:N,N-dimethylformamidase
VIHYEALDRVLGDAGSEICRAKAPAAKDQAPGQPFLIGAHLGEQARSAGHFNGKIEAPCLAAEAIAPADLAVLLGRPRDFPLLAAWDFAQDIETAFIPDIGPRGLHGRAVNLPARGVTGHLWAGRSLSWCEAPAHYAAIHFHEDDLSDCGWETDLAWWVPTGLPSGIYAARLR